MGSWTFRTISRNTCLAVPALWPWSVLIPLFPRALLFSPSPQSLWRMPGSGTELTGPTIGHGSTGTFRILVVWEMCVECNGIILKVLLDSLGSLFRESLKSCLAVSSTLCSYVCNYMVKIDGRWIKNTFCKDVMKLISFDFIQAGSMWRISPWPWVEVSSLLGCFSLCLLFAFEIRKQKKEKTHNSIL